MNKPLVIVTGASSGIGAAIAKVFSAAGYPLGLLARNLAAMEKLDLPNAVCCATDVTDIDALEKTVQIIEKKYGTVNCFINNAGFVKAGDFTEISNQDHVNTVQVNLIGVMNGMQVALPRMREKKAGTIINMSSVADRSVRPNIATYAATKAAVKSLTESLRTANAKYGIRICNIAPGKIKTPMLMAANLSQDHVLNPEELAKTVLWMYELPQETCIRDLVFAPSTYEL